MKPINRPLLIDASSRLLFTMTDEQYDLLIEEFDILLKQMSLIGKIEGVDSLAPMTFPLPVSITSMRDDLEQPTLTQAETVQNASRHLDGQMQLPKVVG
jgi:aspartyl/glutamyl-tRNA(Asn/Gln) amidotransferase C subunit